MSFSYHKKFYSQQTNKSSERCESLEDINFALIIYPNNFTILY